MNATGCPLCDGPGGVPVFQSAKFRVVRAQEPGFPAFYRLVWSDHVAEFTDLPAADRHHCMEAVAEVEQVLRVHLHPAKVNLASLGNAVPHLHWHIVARFDWDSHFPGAVWAAAQRVAPAAAIEAIESQRPALEEDLAGRLAGLPGNHCSVKSAR